MRALILSALLCLISVNQSEAASRVIAGRVSRGSADQVVAITSAGSVSATVRSSGSFRVVLPAGARSTRLALTKDSELVGYMYAPRCTGSRLRCSSQRLAASFRPGNSLPLARLTSGKFILRYLASQRTLYNRTIVKSFVASSAAASARNLGMISAGGNYVQSTVSALAVEGYDDDGDGAVNQFDIDDDNDGITDNYDSSTPSTDPDQTFRIFSNLKVGLEGAVNVNAASVTQEQIDSVMQNNTTLAVQVLATGEQVSELNCGELSYCSAGGTGVKMEGSTAFPGDPGDVNDADSDGFGEITAGGTGDFQLRTGASASQIGAGNTIIQMVTDSTTRQVPGMLSFAFNTTPAIKSVQVNSEAAIDISYPVTDGALGTTNNCFQVPSSGSVSVTLIAWRPQRPGLTGAGEAEYMDIGNSRIVADIPNLPCSGSGGCSGNGPGTCGAGYYTTSDSNLTAEGEGVLDSLGDTAAAAANTATFTLDLSGCLAADSVAWNSGEKVFVDLQFKNSIGDNSAVKTCFQRQ